MNFVQNSFAQLKIIYPNLIHNYNYFKSKLAPETQLLVLIKANSYGHGAVEFARVMEQTGADYFGVAHPIEGVELRQAGLTRIPIIILTAGTDSFELITQHHLEPSIPSLEMLAALDTYLRQNNLTAYPVHINLDTGMHRLGFMKSEVPALIHFIQNTSGRIRIKSAFSHLAASDDPQHDAFTLGQIALFEQLFAELTAGIGYTPMKHVLNSAGIERFPQYQFDMVRLGIGIYGISVVEESLLKPAASLSCKIIQIKNLSPEDGTVGYGRWGKLTGNQRIATIPLGYADGINRHLSQGRARFCVNGKLVPTIGNICMDMCMIDVTGVEAEVGDRVTIFGENPTARELAKILDTIPYEIFTSVSRRVERKITKI